MNRLFSLRVAAILVANAMASDASGEAASMSNISVRGQVRAGRPVVAGFTVADGPEKTVLIRVAGPALAALGMSDALVDPKLELFDARGAKLGENDNFLEADGAIAASVGAFPFAPGGEDAMLVASLTPGSYSVEASGVGGGTGLALVEIYDLSNTNNQLSSLSSRTQLAGAADLAISGFTVAPGPGTRRFLVRAVGTAFRGFNVASGLKNPKLEVFAGSRKIAANDDWSSADEDGISALTTAFTNTGAFPLTQGSTDAALLVDLPAGSYSLQVQSADGSGGGLLMEAYEVPPRLTTDDAGSLANLEVRQFSVVDSSDGYFVWYAPRFQLIETARRGGAVVVSLTLRLGNVYGPAETWKLHTPVLAGASVSVVGADIHGNSPDGNNFGIELGPAFLGMTATITYRVSDGTERVVSATVPGRN